MSKIRERIGPRQYLHRAGLLRRGAGVVPGGEGMQTVSLPLPPTPALRRHPLMGGPCLTDGATCGTCRHLIRTESPAGRRYSKCALRGVTRGPATDVRLRWPGCRAWEARP